MGSRDIFQTIEGMDENGEAKAICCLIVERKIGDREQTSEIENLAYMQNASVKVSLTRDLAVVDLCFESHEDYDYQQTLELCKEYNAMTDTCELKKNPNSNLSLILYVTPKREYDFFLMGVDAVWKLIPKKSGESSNVIRFAFVSEKFGACGFEGRQ